MFCDGGPTKMLLVWFFITKSQSSRQFSFVFRLAKIQCVTKIQRKINKTLKSMMSSELSRAIVDVYPSFTKWAFKWSTFSIISKGATHYCPPRGSFLKSMREGNQIPYYILTREMVLVWYPFDYMSDTFPQRRSTSTSFSVYVKTGVMLRSPSSFWKSVDSDWFSDFAKSDSLCTPLCKESYLAKSADFQSKMATFILL